MWLAILVLFAITVTGLVGVQQTGSYENIFGTMYWYGLLFLILAIIIKLILLAFMIPL